MNICVDCAGPASGELGSGEHICSSCWNRRVDGRRAARKVQLAAMPRCSCCSRRGAWRVYGILLCGLHKRNVQRSHDRSMARIGGIGLFMTPTYSQQDILAMASKKEQTT